VKQAGDIRGLKVARMLHYLYLRKILGKGPVNERTLLKVAGYKGYGGYNVIRNLENQGLITRQEGEYMVTNEGNK